MNRYYFVAISSEGKKFSGTIYAENESLAHEKLKSKGLATLSLEPYEVASEAKKGTEGFQKFSFEGKDKENKPIKGTVEALDLYEAYKKLRQEYNFEVSWLIPEGLSAKEAEEAKKAGISEEITVRFTRENQKFALEQKKKKDKEQEIALAAREKEEEIKFFQQKITEILKSTTEMLEKNSEFLDSKKKREIKERLDLLARLRQSNAIDHLRNLTDKLLEQLSDDQLFLESSSPEKLAEIEARRGQFKKFSDGVGTTIATGLSQIKLNFRPPSILEVEQKIVELNPVGKVAATLYWAVVSLFGILVTFWVANGIQLVLGKEVKKILYYFDSPILWFLTGFSALLSLIFAPQIFAKEPLSWKKRAIFASIGVGAILLFVIEFPAIFAWTR